VGRRFGKRAELFGGIALVGLGGMILLQHTGFLAGQFE
jgi:putative Mn2+ efflux pump MntP